MHLVIRVTVEGTESVYSMERAFVLQTALPVSIVNVRRVRVPSTEMKVIASTSVSAVETTHVIIEDFVIPVKQEGMAWRVKWTAHIAEVITPVIQRPDTARLNRVQKVIMV